MRKNCQGGRDNTLSLGERMTVLNNVLDALPLLNVIISNTDKGKKKDGCLKKELYLARKQREQEYTSSQMGFSLML